MASSIEEPMPQTLEAYKELVQRDHDLFMTERDTWNKKDSLYRIRINNLEQLVEKMKTQPKNMTQFAFSINCRLAVLSASSLVCKSRTFTFVQFNFSKAAR